ncbi:MAG: hypothetical protein BGO69_10460 [Bacteroidetes bacterium 46-16]|nr:MAG: hypothetical protein BGO69_10460 [Bacteroidetes bacterium 46-16]
MDLDFKALAAAKTDDELSDIYINPEKYNEDLLPFAEAELAKRGIYLSPLDEKRRLKVARETPVLVHEERGKPLHLIIFFILAFAGGLIGIVAGYHYGYSYKRGFGGQKYYEFDKNTRSFGRIIFLTGLLVLIFVASLRARHNHIAAGQAG